MSGIFLDLEGRTMSDLIDRQKISLEAFEGYRRIHGNGGVYAGSSLVRRSDQRATRTRNRFESTTNITTPNIGRPSGFNRLVRKPGIPQEDQAH